MKLPACAPHAQTSQSLPVRGAWIEIIKWKKKANRNGCRSPCGERGLKSLIPSSVFRILTSLPVRGAWIEIIVYSFIAIFVYVAPRAGSVD